MKKHIIYILLPILFIAIIFALSSIPEDKILDGINSLTPIKLSPIGQAAQNLAHIPIYSILAVLLMKLFNKTKIENLKKIIYILLIILVFGALDELHQHFVPGRTASFLDISLDIIGGLAGLIIYRVISLRRFCHCEDSDPDLDLERSEREREGEEDEAI